MIKTIIFDFGGVLIDLDKEATFIELERLGLSALTVQMIKYNERYEKGLIDTNEFISFYKGHFSMATDQLLKDAWNSIILDIPEHRLKFIEDLRAEGRFQLILLSNTNELHMQKVIEKMGIKRYRRFKNSFHFFYLSHEIKLRKPDPEIYRYVLDRHDIIPNECLFIDDTTSHSKSASGLGIHTWKLDAEKEDVTSLFEVKRSLFN